MLIQYETSKDRLKEIHRLIKTRATGTRSQFAKKLNLSESQLSNYLHHIRKQGIKVAYDYYNQCYYYQEESAISYDCGFQKNKITG